MNYFDVQTDREFYRIFNMSYKHELVEFVR